MVGLVNEGWTVASASVRGGQHTRSGRPNQDRHAIQRLPTGAVVLAIADGHGGSRYTRAERGADLGVHGAVAVLAGLVAGGHNVFDVADVPRRLTVAWQQAVDADLRTSPLPDREQAQVGGDPRVAYGCTLAVALLDDSRGMIWQVGDGDALVRHDDRAARRVVPGDPRLVGNATTSLCGAHPELDFRTARFDCDRTTLVLLATDGYGNAFADDDWPEKVMSDFNRHLQNGGVGLVREHLPHWLEESAMAGGDDVTVIIAYRHQAPGPS